MKTTFLLISGLFLSVASFAQTNVKSNAAIRDNSSIQSDKASGQVNSSADVSSATDIHTEAISNAKRKSSAQIKKEKKALAAEKRAQAAEANDKGQMISAIASDGSSISGQAHSKAKTDVSAKDNNLNNNASLNSNGRISATGITNSGNASVKSANRVKTHLNRKAIKARKKINATSANVVEAAHNIHPKPVSIKTGAQVRTNAGIKIR
jgi:flagellar biosynthesis GTPase FlhF